MVTNVAFIVSGNGTLSVSYTDDVDGTKLVAVPIDHLNYDSVKEALLDPLLYDTLPDLLDISKSVQQYVGTGAQVVDGSVVYKGQPLHNLLTERILQMKQQGFPFEHMCRFLDNLMLNPSSRAVNELYKFLEHVGLPITDDGCFLAYKSVRDDWMDHHTGTVSNHIGATPTMERNTVDDNCNNTCSHGYHVGTLQYAKDFCRGRLVVVKVNPKDAVSVPIDHDAQKLRVCSYEVVAEYTGPLDQSAIYQSNSDPLEAQNIDALVSNESDRCPNCGSDEFDCVCDLCPDCGEDYSDCVCNECWEERAVCGKCGENREYCWCYNKNG